MSAKITLYIHLHDLNFKSHVWSDNDFLYIYLKSTGELVEKFTIKGDKYEYFTYFNIDEGEYTVNLSESLRNKHVHWSISVINSGVTQNICNSDTNKMTCTFSLNFNDFKSLTSVNSEYGIIDNLIVKNIVFADYNDFPLQVRTLDTNPNQSRLLLGDNIAISRVFKNKSEESENSIRDLRIMNLSYPVKKR